MTAFAIFVCVHVCPKSIDYAKDNYQGYLSSKHDRSVDANKGKCR
ncbi:hypothetical protein MPTK1_8g12280 [Marchantia polymorpha subsp. ruderalis]|nr:hypothetical protein Mp_8g12280 [Marchantia polymorpha subsp. ruderalis]